LHALHRHGQRDGFGLLAGRADQALQAGLHKICIRVVKPLTRRGVFIEEEGSTQVAALPGSPPLRGKPQRHPPSASCRAPVDLHHFLGDQPCRFSAEAVSSALRQADAPKSNVGA
jgi:hypothetical protein